MSFSIEFADESQAYEARIKVNGVGGSGGNAVNTMINFGLEGVEFIVVNTDAQALNANAAPTKLPIGSTITARSSAPGRTPTRVRKAALEDVQRIKEAHQRRGHGLRHRGHGRRDRHRRGSGHRAACARGGRAHGGRRDEAVPLRRPAALAPRGARGSRRSPSRSTPSSPSRTRSSCCSATTTFTFIDACRKADEVLFQAVKGISDLITQNGIVNVDFADVKTVMSAMGRALMGTGIAKGQTRARLAAEMAIHSPLLDEISVEGATGVLINIVGGPDLKMKEIQEAASLVQEQAHEDANIIFGASIDETLGESVKVTVIATGFDAAERELGLDVTAARPSHAPHSAPVSSASYGPASAHRDPRAHSAPPSNMRPTLETMPSPSPRRPAHQHEVRTHAAASQQRPVLRQALTQDAFPNLDHDWDVPAFQRKQR